MRGAYIEEFGGPEKLKIGERPAPEPGAGELLVRTKAAGVGYWDVKAVSGVFAKLPLPMIPGYEVGGVVERTTEESDLAVGDEVYASLGFHAGGWAEYAACRADRTARKPREATFEEAAGLVIAAGTAHEGLVDRGHVQSGETVLITGASGGVGSAAVQIAAALGARVFAVASARNHEFLKNLGATEVFDYHSADWAEQVQARSSGGVDVLFDTAGGETREAAIRAVRDAGRGIFVADFHGDLPSRISVERFSALVTDERLRAVARLVDDRKLRAYIEAVHPLEEAATALAHVAGRHARGKVVLRIG